MIPFSLDGIIALAFIAFGVLMIPVIGLIMYFGDYGWWSLLSLTTPIITGFMGYIVERVL